MSRTASNPPAIVLGVGITALGVMRCLSRSGIRTYSADEKIDFVRYSRYFAKPPGTAPISATNQLTQFLSEINLENAVLMPCGDQWSRAIYDIDADLKQRFSASVPSFEVWNMLTDKGLLADFLTKHEIPHPRSIHIDQESDLQEAETLFPGEWFIKPRDSEKFFRTYWVKAFKVADVDELRKRAARLFADGLGFILQEYIPGPASNHIFIDGFIDRNGAVAGLFARQRLRMYPHLFGNSSYMVTIDRSQAAREIDLILSSLRAASYRGIFSVEFKRDQRDGTPKLLEINTRPWWYIWFAERCGMPIAHMAYLDALGENVNPTEKYDVGTHMVYPLNDMYACRDFVKSGEMTYGAWISDWLKAKQAVFWIGDPLPSFVWFLRVLLRFLRRRLSGKRRKPLAPGSSNRTKV